MVTLGSIAGFAATAFAGAVAKEAAHRLVNAAIAGMTAETPHHAPAYVPGG